VQVAAPKVSGKAPLSHCWPSRNWTAARDGPVAVVRSRPISASDWVMVLLKSPNSLTSLNRPRSAAVQPVRSGPHSRPRSPATRSALAESPNARGSVSRAAATTSSLA